YPFARERYWLEPESMAPGRTAQAAIRHELSGAASAPTSPVVTEPPLVSAQEPSPEVAVPAWTETQLLEATLGFCTQLVGQALKLDASLIDVTEPLESYGIDSISVGLINRLLQQHFGDVGATLLYEHRTVEALARHLFHTEREVLNRLLGAAGGAASISAPA